MPDLVLGSTTILSDSSGTPTIQSGVAFPANHVVQTVYEETDTVSGISNTSAPGDVWLSKSITPRYSNSKILRMLKHIEPPLFGPRFFFKLEGFLIGILRILGFFLARFVLKRA